MRSNPVGRAVGGSSRAARGSGGAVAALLRVLRLWRVTAVMALGLAGLGLLPAVAEEPPSGAAPSGAAVFAGRCAVCHGAEAAGIPGSFPSLHEQIVGFAKTPEGRDYLVMVVTTGLMGELKVAGVTYRGVMPAQSGLSDAEIAAVITYLGSDRGKDTAVTALTADEVQAIHGRHPDRSPQTTRALRPAAQSPTASAGDGAAPVAPGVSNGRRAWQNWTLNCQGCHRPDGTGSPSTAPSLAGTVSRFLTVPGGREYVARVPGVATSPLANPDLAELMNWILWRFDAEHMPADFTPFTADEIGSLRTRPLRLEASVMRSDLLRRADETAAP
jgi:mono/diheme cytochrome c family protein